MRKLIIAACTVFMVMALAACGGSASSGASTSSAIVTVKADCKVFVSKFVKNELRTVNMVSNVVIILIVY